MILLLLLAVLNSSTNVPISRTVHRGDSFALRLDGLKSNRVPIVNLTAELVSECDDEEAILNSGSFRKDGTYYAVFQIPDSAGVCVYKVSQVDVWRDYDQEEPYVDQVEIGVEVVP